MTQQPPAPALISLNVNMNPGRRQTSFSLNVQESEEEKGTAVTSEAQRRGPGLTQRGSVEKSATY